LSASQSAPLASNRRYGAILFGRAVTVKTTDYHDYFVSIQRGLPGCDIVVSKRYFLLLGIFILSAVTVVTVSFRDASAQAVNLNGDWVSQYSCPSGVVYPLRARVSQNGQQVSGIRLKGDPCYAVDNTLLFRGSVIGYTGQMQCAVLSEKASTYDDSKSFAQNMLQGLAEGAAGTPQYVLSYVQDSLQLTGPNNFTACGLSWTRVGGGVPAPGQQQAFGGPGQHQNATPGFASPGQPQAAQGGFASPGQQQSAQGGFVSPGQQQAAQGGFAKPGQQQFATPGFNPNKYALACLYLDPNLTINQVNFQFRIGNGLWQNNDTQRGFVSSLFYLIPSGNGAPPVTLIRFQSALGGGQGAVVTYNLDLDPAPTNDCVKSSGRRYRWALNRNSQHHIDLVPY
jgi:hypothetical protein